MRRLVRSTLVADDLVDEVTDLLQHLIRNACVNDGNVASGHEARSVDTLARVPRRRRSRRARRTSPRRVAKSLVARIEGTRPDAPTLLLMGHTDVVPVNADRWRHDPFGGELIDGEVWGRGAVDMLNLTSSMAVAMRAPRRLRVPARRARSIYLAVADEEALGTWGAHHLVDHELRRGAGRLRHHRVRRHPDPARRRAQAPGHGRREGLLLVPRSPSGARPGHGSQPWRTDNALVKAAEVVRRIAAYAPATDINDVWRRFVDGIDLPEELDRGLLVARRLHRRPSSTCPLGIARQFHACTHTTFSPNIVHGGSKINTIPDAVDLQVDIRTLPGQTAEDVEAQLREAVGDLADDVDVHRVGLRRRVRVADRHPAVGRRCTRDRARASTRTAQTVPMLIVGATDARFFRRLGATAYGYGLFSRNLSFEDYSTMFHGDDERVDQESLRLSTELWQVVARELLG